MCFSHVYQPPAGRTFRTRARAALFLVPLLLAPVPASAHLHNAADCFAFSMREGSAYAAGAQYAHEWVLGVPNTTSLPLHRRPVSVVFDASLHFPDGAAVGVGMGGLRLSFGPLPEQGEPRTSFSVHALAGVQMKQDYTQNGFIGGFGGAVDLMWWESRGVRIQGDLLSAPYRDGHHWKLRASVGLVWKRN